MRAKGVDYNSKVKLRKLWSEGYDSGYIAQRVSVDEKVVKGWMEHFEGKFPNEAPEKESEAPEEEEEEE